VTAVRNSEVDAALAPLNVGPKTLCGNKSLEKLQFSSGRF